MSTEQEPFDKFFEGTPEAAALVHRRLGIPLDEPLRMSHLARYKELT